jgi:hypothetical protein
MGTIVRAPQIVMPMSRTAAESMKNHTGTETIPFMYG